MRRKIFSLLLLAVAGLGCAGDANLQYSLDGVQYGVTKGPFHGRWWNLYERGVSFAGGSFHAEAERDFQAALDGHPRDGWQARTYGLHFVPYFPNRELGISYYRQGKLDAAESSLFLSLDHVDTARAHYYLDLVKTAKVEVGLSQDARPPTIESSVEDGSVVAARKLEFNIRARDDLGVAIVRVNGKRLQQRGSGPDIAYVHSILLDEGPQEVRIEATDLAGNLTLKTYKVTLDITGPTVGIFEPAPNSVTQASSIHLRGVSVDADGVVAVEAGGRVVARSRSDTGDPRIEFSTELRLEDGENEFTVLARDRAGNETFTTIQVFKGLPGSAQARLWQLEKRAPSALQFAQAAGTAVLSLSALPAADEENVTIRLKSPKVDRPYRHNRVLRIKGEVVSSGGIASIVINGEDYPYLTGAPMESFNKGIPIDADSDNTGPSQFKIVIEASDAGGITASETFEIDLSPVFLNTVDSKMQVAVLAFGGQTEDPGLNERIRTLTIEQLRATERFNVVERSVLETTATEELLAEALANPKAAVKVAKDAKVHVVFIAEVLKFGNEFEVIGRAVDPETSIIIAHVDTNIADARRDDLVTAGCSDLARQLVDLFPRLSGEVVAVRRKSGGDEIFLNWTREDGLQEGMYLLILQEGNAGSGNARDEVEFVPIGRARIERILKSNTKAKVVIETDAEGAKPIERGMPVIAM